MPASVLCASMALLALVVSPAGAVSVFFDGFEVGSVCAWSSTLGAPPCCGALLLEENFTLPDGSAWPAPWTAAGNEVAVADVQQGWGRLRPDPSSYSLARMVAPGNVSAVQVLFTMVFEEASSQGVGFYARQNGGYLQQTTPFGQGYAVFVEAFRGPAIGLWYESGGVEASIDVTFDNNLGLTSGVPYRVRYLLQDPPPAANAAFGGPDSHLQARVWPLGSSEPALWKVDVLDSLGVLQGVDGGFAIDSWSNRTSAITAHTLIDDIQIFAV
ncbi:MAG: hypothetical protein ABIV06_04695 [Thermoanaerobaculia bacterium]